MSVYLAGVYQSRLEELEISPDLLRKLRRADDFIRLAVVAASQVVLNKAPGSGETADDYGLILGTAYGTMQTNFDVLGSVVFEKLISPIQFTHSVFNAAAGYMATVLNLQGCALTITDFSFPFFRALQEGFLAVSSGRLDRCLVLQVEIYSQLLLEARGKHAPGLQDWSPGVVCWMLEKNVVDGCQIHCPEIQDREYEPHNLLQFYEQFSINELKQDVHDPLGSATALSEAIQNGCNPSELDCRVKGPWGEVRLQLNQNK